MQWTLLIYTVPAEPSRLRAAVWRDLKRLGTVYLRDGVCGLPESKEAAVALRSVVGKITDFGGQATLVEAADLDSATSHALAAQLQEARDFEYQEIGSEARALLFHIQHEGPGRELHRQELRHLASDADKIERWLDQVQARDYLEAGPPVGLQGLLAEIRTLLRSSEAGVAET